MNQRWFLGVNKEEEGDLKSRILAAEDVLTHLCVMLEEDFSELQRISMKDDFDTPAWDKKQAYMLGKLHSIRHLQSIINIKE